MLELIHDGIDNRVYLVTDAAAKRYILRESKRTHVSRSVAFEAATIALLIRSGIPTPAIVTTQSGLPGAVIDGHDATMFEHVPGFQFEDMSPELVARGILDVGARALGALHAATRGQAIPEAPKRTIFTELDRFVEIKNHPLLKGIDGYAELVSEAADLRERAEAMIRSSSADMGIIHNDYRIQNLIFQDDSRCSIIDLDWACPGPLLKDVGLAIAEWSMFDFVANVPSRSAIDGFIDAYNETAPAPVSYGKDLLFWISFSCLSDACTFFVDLVEGRYEGKSIVRTEQCRMYRKFEYFAGVAA